MLSSATSVSSNGTFSGWKMTPHSGKYFASIMETPSAPLSSNMVERVSQNESARLVNEDDEIELSAFSYSKADFD